MGERLSSEGDNVSDPFNNVYCDESSHLLSSAQQYMLLGAIWCPGSETGRIAHDLRKIKREHGVWAQLEVKWTKVSPGKLDLYLAVLQYFMNDPALSFRVLIADKSGLRHDDFGQTHDDWYYKMYYALLHPLLTPGTRWRIYLDIKDTRGGARARKLHDVLSNKLKDFAHERVDRVQLVRSHEVEQVQLVDLLTGAVGYALQGAGDSAGKVALVEALREASPVDLTVTSALSAKKINVFRWTPQGLAEE